MKYWVINDSENIERIKLDNWIEAKALLHLKSVSWREFRAYNPVSDDNLHTRTPVWKPCEVQRVMYEYIDCS